MKTVTILGIVGVATGGVLLAWYLLSKKECEIDADCPAGYICVDGVCVPEDDGVLGAITGTVTDCETGGAISGATVTLDAERTTTTDASGNFSFSNVAVGQHWVCYEYTGYRSDCDVIAVREGATADGSECLTPGVTPPTGAIHFSVKECSEIPYVPFPGVKCYANGHSCVTNADGVCNIENLEPGTYQCDCDVPAGYEPYQDLPEAVQVVAGYTAPKLIMLFPI